MINSSFLSFSDFVLFERNQKIQPPLSKESNQHEGHFNQPHEDFSNSHAAFLNSCEGYFNQPHEEDKQLRERLILLGFSTFDEIDLLDEINGRTHYLRKLVQLSCDDNCTVFCGIKMRAGDLKSMGIAVAHKGKLYDIADRTLENKNDDYIYGGSLKIYNTKGGKIGVLVDSDAAHIHLWKRINEADFILAMTANEGLNSEILAISNSLQSKAILKTPSTTILNNIE